MKNGQVIIGVDPGLKGALVALFDMNGVPNIQAVPMPLDRQNEIDFEAIRKFLKPYPMAPVFLERAVSFGMGLKGAFNYGRGFAMVELAIKLSRNPVTYVESGKWTKAMHQGIDSNLKPKAKSLIALQRLYGGMKGIPLDKKGNPHDGVVDALLIAGYGKRQQGGDDFY